jgi:hypothetical protein
MHELRCGGTMHAKLLEDNLLEVKCGRRSCGARRGVVILHTFDLTTGQMTGTAKFAEPPKERNDHGTGQLSAVRSA